MMDVAIGFILVGMLVALIVAGTPIGVALIFLSLTGTWMVRGNLAVAVSMVGSGAFSSIAENLFSVIPLFVLMGMLVSVSGVGQDTFGVAQWLLRRVRGGLGIATVDANTLFAAVTGISVASASVFAQVAVPPMLHFGYTPRFAVGVVAGSSILGMLIPPSILMIVYGVLAEVSIGRMFLAGVIPGLIMAGAFVLLIVLLARFKPAYVFSSPGAVAVNEKAETTAGMLAKMVPIVLLIVTVLGGLYGGVFTATECGAMGALGAFLIAGARRRLNLPTLWSVLVETGYVSVGILFLLMAASMYSRMLTMAGIPAAIGSLIEEFGVGRYGFLAVYVLCVVLMGMILDSVSILLIVTPIAVPIAKSFGMDLVQFGVISVVAVETGLLTPPFGLSVFAVKSALGDASIRLETIFAGALPYVAVMLAVLGLLTAFPALSIWLAY
ncbi:MAG: TRAP transporter large permease subunit [Proteobacteria bacterium]|nr:TRAP transporter large permease subunit [Pseudomonadota bacterium]